MKIVGISLVKNEDKYIRRVLSNVLAFCDEFIVVDNMSTDQTLAIVESLKRETTKVAIYQEQDAAFSHGVIRDLAGTPTWIFAVDGDEIYDPVGLEAFREKLCSGEFNDYWQIFGNVLNCEVLDLDSNSAQGYLAPPCRSMTKLFNFNAIESWDGECPERLHGGRVVFRSGYSWDSRLFLHHQFDWHEAIFRCLHLCFISRSSIDKDQSGNRQNIVELRSKRWWQRMWRYARRGRSGEMSRYKREKYCRGEIVKVETTAFFGKDL